VVCCSTGLLTHFLIQYLAQRSISDLLSVVANLICGVIQGSVIVPPMFFIYVNGLVTLLNNFDIKVKLFADVKLYVGLKVVNKVACDELYKLLCPVSLCTCH